MSIGNANIHQRGEIPEIIKLPNGRLRVVRRFHKFTREDVDDANLGSLMGNFGDLDDANEQIPDQGYTNCRLISVEVDTRFNRQSNAENPVLVKTYETLTDSFVQIEDDAESTTSNGLKTVTRVFRAASGTISSDVVGTTTSGGLTLASSKIVDNDAFAELIQTFVETGILDVSISEKYNGVLKESTVRSIGLTSAAAKTAANAVGVLLDSSTSEFEGLQSNVFRFVDGEGEISRTSNPEYGGILTITTIVSINQEPTATSGNLVDSKVDNRDGYLFYTYRFAEGSGEISKSDNAAGNGVFVRTLTHLNESPPDQTGYVLQESSTSAKDGYFLVTNRYLKKEGIISTETEAGPSYLPTSTITRISQYGEMPTGEGTLFKSSTQDSDGFTIFTAEFITVQGGEIASYQDAVEVEVAGKVNCGTATSQAGDESGTVAVAYVVPVSRKTVIANVSISITTEPQVNSATPAYSLEGIGCSVTSSKASARTGGGNTVQLKIGKTNSSRTGFQKNYSLQSNVSTFSGCELESSSSFGSVNFKAEERPRVDDNKIVVDNFYSSTTTACTGTAFSGSQPTSGLLKSRVRTLATLADGTTWFEQITWTV